MVFVALSRTACLVGYWRAMRHADATDGEAEGDCCPICGSDAGAGPCEHHLASFDRTFGGELLGVGLGGGALYGAERLSLLVQRLLGLLRAGLIDESHPIHQERWSRHPVVGDFVQAHLAVDAAPGQMEGDDWEYWIVELLADSGEATRELIESVLSAAGVAFGCTFWVSDSMPGQSSQYEEWWCGDPDAAVD